MADVDQYEIRAVSPVRLYFMTKEDFEKKPPSSETKFFGDVSYDPSDPHFTTAGLPYKPDFYFGDMIASLRHIKVGGKLPSLSFMVEEFKKTATKLRSVHAHHPVERDAITNTFEDFLSKCGSEMEFLKFHRERLRRKGVEVDDQESAKMHILSKEFAASKLAYLPPSIQSFLSKKTGLIRKDTGCSCMNKKKKKFSRTKMMAQNLTYVEVVDAKSSTCSCMRKRKIKFSGCSCFKKNKHAVPEAGRWKLFGTKFIATDTTGAEIVNVPKDPVSGVSALDFVSTRDSSTMKESEFAIIATLTGAALALGFTALGPFLAFIVSVIMVVVTVFSGIIIPILLFALGVIFATKSGRAFAEKVVSGAGRLVGRVAKSISNFFRGIWDKVKGIFTKKKKEQTLDPEALKDTSVAFTTVAVAAFSVLTLLALTEEFYNFSIEAKPEVDALIKESTPRIKKIIRLAIAHFKNSNTLKQLLGANIGLNQPKTSREALALWEKILRQYTLIDPAIAAAVSLYQRLGLGDVTFHKFIKTLKNVSSDKLAQYSPTIIKLWISRSALTREQVDGLVLLGVIEKGDYEGKTAYDEQVKNEIQRDMSRAQLNDVPHDLLMGWIHSSVLNVSQVAYLLSGKKLDWNDLEGTSYLDISDQINASTFPVAEASKSLKEETFTEILDYHKETRRELDLYIDSNLE